jgi:hypothetical protein
MAAAILLGSEQRKRLLHNKIFLIVFGQFASLRSGKAYSGTKHQKATELSARRN